MRIKSSGLTARGMTHRADAVEGEKRPLEEGLLEKGTGRDWPPRRRASHGICESISKVLPNVFLFPGVRGVF